MQVNDLIDVENFDREYGLAELLPVETVADLLMGLDDVVMAVIVLPDGTPHYGAMAIPAEQMRAAAPAGRAQGPIAFATARGRALAFPLVHELETIGLLWVQKREEIPDRCLAAFAGSLGKILNRMIRMNYAGKLTYGLHGQVVTEAHHTLKEKAAQLQQSEEKYRLLSEHLELEVQRKTREVKETQLKLLQQEKIAAIGRLAAGMAHEINNPIGFVISNLNTLKSCVESMSDLIHRYERLAARVAPSAAGQPLVAQALTEIDDARQVMEIDYLLSDAAQLIPESLEGAGRVQAIVQNLRDFTHPSVESRESANINRCLDTTLAILAPQTPAGVNIAKAYQPIPQATCYLREINQVFYQILRNALQAVGARGEIAIGTRVDGGQVEIRIGDSGPGIPQEHHVRIFDPFFTTREVGQGTGLGLHLAHSIVRKHGGAIRVESHAGQGATFVIRIPLDGPDNNSSL